MKIDAIETRPLTSTFGIEVLNVDLTNVTEDGSFPALRALFDEHSALVFRNQNFSDQTHLKLVARFGPIEDRKADERKPGEAFTVPEVSNIMADGSVTDEMDLHTLNLQANFQWHSDSTFLPIPALINIITARVIPSEAAQPNWPQHGRPGPICPKT